MKRASVPVDLFNPGQVFACFGLAEAAAQLLGEARGAFDWSDAGGQAWFHVLAPDKDPLAHVLDFLTQATVEVYTCDKELVAEQEIQTRFRRDETFPIARPNSPATLPAVASLDGRELWFQYWGDSTHRDNFKLWAGMAGMSGAKLLRNALDLISTPRPTTHDPFNQPSNQSGSFNLDWRRTYVPIDAGFSPNAHKSGMTTRGYPLVEILGAYGLAHARPRRHQSKLDYSYGVICSPDGDLLPSRSSGLRWV